MIHTLGLQVAAEQRGASTAACFHHKFYIFITDE